MPSILGPELEEQIAKACQAIAPDAISFRHQCHERPELTWNETQTAARVAEYCRKIEGLEVQEGVGKLGVVALLEGAHPGPTVALRADMDALPIQEETGLSYASKNNGVMHACGHDGHMANLYGAAQVIAKFKDQIHGRIKFIFQPAEEGGAGALKMCEDGVLEAPKVDVIFGLHGWPEAKESSIWYKEGAMLASNTNIEVTVKGKGTHAAMPHLGSDQVLAACRMIESLQSVVSRSISPSDAAALSITQIEGGKASNVIPGEVTFGGTLRTLDPEVRHHCYKRIEEIITGTAKAMGVEASVKLTPVYPETVNHRAPTEFVEKVARSLFPENQVNELPAASMGAEDFSFYLERVPGAFFLLGMNDGRDGGYPPLHHPEFDFNDKAITTGMMMFSHLALSYGRAQNSPRTSH